MQYVNQPSGSQVPTTFRSHLILSRSTYVIIFLSINLTWDGTAPKVPYEMHSRRHTRTQKHKHSDLITKGRNWISFPHLMGIIIQNLPASAAIPPPPPEEMKSNVVPSLPTSSSLISTCTKMPCEARRDEEQPLSGAERDEISGDTCDHEKVVCGCRDPDNLPVALQ